MDLDIRDLCFRSQGWRHRADHGDAVSLGDAQQHHGLIRIERQALTCGTVNEQIDSGIVEISFQYLFGDIRKRSFRVLASKHNHVGMQKLVCGGFLGKRNTDQASLGTACKQ